MSTQEKPSQGGLESGGGGVCVLAVPMPHGYPNAPPPPNNTSSPANFTTQVRAEYSSPYRNGDKLCGSCIAVLLCFGLAFLLCQVLDRNIHPRINVESVSVTLYKSIESGVIAAQWNLAFSFKDMNIRSRYSNYNMRGLDVWVMCMSGNGTGAIVKPDRGDYPILLNATVNTIFSNYTHRGSTLDFEVMLHVTYEVYRFEATCKNMTVTFLPNTTQGIMKGGSILCHA